jgi:hypothetical protein
MTREVNRPSVRSQRTDVRLKSAQKVGGDGAEMIAVKRPFAACGKLMAIANEPAESQGVHQMSLDDVRAVYHDVFVA